MVLIVFSGTVMNDLESGRIRLFLLLILTNFLDKVDFGGFSSFRVCLHLLQPLRLFMPGDEGR